MGSLYLTIEQKYKEHYKFIRCNFDFPVDLNYRKFLRDDKKFVLVVRNPNLISNNSVDDILAISVFSIFDDRINNDYTVVKKEYRRMGINKKIKNYIEDVARSNYIDIITASVRENNICSLNSLLKCGYVISKRRSKYKNGDIKLRLFKNLTY